MVAMILDTIENLSSYYFLNSGFKKAFDFLSRADLKDLPAGKYEIDGEHIFAIIVNDLGEAKNEGLLEVHRKYIDIQFVVAGTDEMGWKPKSLCLHPKSNYDEESDAQNFKDEPATWISVQKNSYAIFFPEDAHMAMFSSGIIHKVIIKVAVNKE
ncbi:MAG: YhcH/YjgK/YiaL family protein [Desulfobulbus sp.]|nr:YhcH/YjgK/YiaL family protein [Desulfobulbus sp.]